MSAELILLAKLALTMIPAGISSYKERRLILEQAADGKVITFDQLMAAINQTEATIEAADKVFGVDRASNPESTSEDRG